MILDDLDLDKNDGPCGSFLILVVLFGPMRHAVTVGERLSRSRDCARFATSGSLEIVNIIHIELCFYKMLSKVHFKRTVFSRI